MFKKGSFFMFTNLVTQQLILLNLLQDGIYGSQGYEEDVSPYHHQLSSQADRLQQSHLTAFLGNSFLDNQEKKNASFNIWSCKGASS